jgi:hypothetical protein
VENGPWDTVSVYLMLIDLRLLRKRVLKLVSIQKGAGQDSTGKPITRIVSIN